MRRALPEEIRRSLDDSASGSEEQVWAVCTLQPEIWRENILDWDWCLQEGIMTKQEYFETDLNTKEMSVEFHCSL